MFNIIVMYRSANDYKTCWIRKIQTVRQNKIGDFLTMGAQQGILNVCTKNNAALIPLEI